MELVHTLEDLERNLPPIGLCIYLTDNGQVQHVRTHAHWILNHARIHHPSFGKREQRKAIEDAEFRERRPGEDPEPYRHREPGFLAALWDGIRTSWRDTFHPYPPPVRQEWMLILVMDVQLETACFSWGYMLDPYVNPDSINSCIIGARLQFRERAMVTGLKKVMRSVVHNIALEAHSVNRRLRRRMTAPPGAVPLLLTGALLLPLSAESTAQEQMPPPATVQLLQDDTAEEVPPTPVTPSAQAEDAPRQQEPPRQTDNADIPRWSSEHYKLLMTGELDTGYVSLFPAPPEQEAEKDKNTKKTEQKKPERKPRPARRNKENRESDTTVPVQYHQGYVQESLSGLIDPQGLLSTMEQNDVLYLLNELNTRARFQIYVTLFKGTQQIPTHLTTDSLLNVSARHSDYAVLIRYPIGMPSSIEIAYKGMQEEKLSRGEWLEKVRMAAASDGEGGAAGLLSAIRSISDCITPLSREFSSIQSRHNVKLPPAIDIEYRPEQKKEDNSFRQKLVSIATDPINLPYFITLGVIILLILLTLAYYFLVRRKGAILLETHPDLRLSSPYGAGVSRYVRYLDGKEASRTKRLF